MQDEAFNSVSDANRQVVSLTHHWAGRDKALVIIGMLLGIAVAAYIASLFSLRGEAIILVGVGAVAGSALAVCWSRLRPYWREIAVAGDVVELVRTNGRRREINLHDIDAVVLEAMDLITLIPGRSVAVDLYTRQRMIRIFASMSATSKIGELIGSANLQTLLFPVECKACIPPPPTSRASDWFDKCRDGVRRVMRRVFLQAVCIGTLFLVAGAGAVALTVIWVQREGEKGINGALLLAIIVPFALAAICYWLAWRTFWRHRGFLHQLEQVRNEPSACEIATDGRIELWIDESLPQELAPMGKWASALSVPLSIIPVVGLVLAIMGLRSTWNHEGTWKSLAWTGFVLSCAFTIMGALAVMAEIFGWD